MSPSAITPEQFHTFGELIKFLRRKSHLTQRQLAVAVGYSDTQISRIEQNQRIPDDATLNALFVPALEIENKPAWVMRMIELSKTSHDERNPNPPTLPDKPPVSYDLPPQLTSFIGRKKEITEVNQLLQNHRLVTLTGSGGTGKTRLSIQIGQDQVHTFQTAVWFIDFATINDTALVPYALANQVGLRESQNSKLGILEIIAEYFQSRKAMLILDNCEHLINACAQLVDVLLRSCGELSILTTSREPLGVKGEVVYQVPTLELATSNSDLDTVMKTEASQLFMERARDSISGFSLSLDNASIVAQICSSLDGIPLAIELAAARLKIMSLEQVATRLEDRFHLLTGGSRTSLPRQQTLRATVDWSYELLSAAEQLLFQRLSIFAGGWTLESAEEICSGNGIDSDNIVDLTTQLVNKSLLIAVQHPSSHEVRFRMLETIRQYAREKLLETHGSEECQRKHLAYFVKFVGKAESELYHSNQVWWLNRLNDELDNLRAALDWALINNVQAGLQLIVTSRLFWEARGNHRELGNWMGQYLEIYKGMDSLRSNAQVIYSRVLAQQGDFIRAQSIANESLQLSRSTTDKQAEAFSLLGLGSVIALQGDLRQGIPIVEQSLALYKSLGDQFGQANATGWLSINNNDLEASKKLVMESLELHRQLGNISGIAANLNELAHRFIWDGNFSSAIPALEEALSISRVLGDQSHEADVLENYGNLYFWMSDYPQACISYEASIKLGENVGDHILVLWGRVNMTYAILRQGNIPNAKKLFRLCVEQFQKANSTIGIVYAIEGLASLFVMQGDLQLAAKLFAWSDGVREHINDFRPPVERASVERDLAVIQSQVNHKEYLLLMTAGRSMPFEEAIKLAVEDHHD